MSSLRFSLVSLEFRDAVLVVERHRGPVLDGAGEVVDRDVVAEHLAGAFLFAGDQRRAGEAEESRIGQRVPHVQREDVVLAAVGLVGDDDDVAAVGELRVDAALVGAELLDQGEDVAVILAQQQLQVAAAVGLYLGPVIAPVAAKVL